ncbi:hypothetical protein [Pelosinus sp. HCF1]|nr:hypothetical protein [Pelosinus sp. HCF1]
MAAGNGSEEAAGAYPMVENKTSNKHTIIIPNLKIVFILPIL